MKKTAVFILFYFATQICFSQEKDSKLPLNQTDNHGKKHGMWYISKPERMGEPGTMEIGTYVHGGKNGNWYKMNQDVGEIISIESYKNDLLDGEVKYFESGKLYCIGHYKSLNRQYLYDTIVVEDPVSGLEEYRVLSTETGTLRHGTWRYYEPETGQLIKEETYFLDELVYRKQFTVSATADSILKKNYQKRLPHNKKKRYSPPSGKKHSYTDF